jgi:putative chitinase
MTIDVKRLQATLGVATDGIAGVNTFVALFRKCGASLDRAIDLAVCAARWFPDYGILDSSLRLAHLLAQLIHESSSFRYMEELASGSAYEGRTDLGNTQIGDGVRFKGRGPLQVTGRKNYRHFGRAIGVDLETNPTLAAVPSIGLFVALQFWKEHGLNALADADDLLGITHAVNGGTNGLDDRRAALATLKGWLP